MIALTFLLTHLRLAGIAAGALACLLVLGWVGHLVERHKQDAARLALLEQQLASAAETNQQTMAELARFKAETEKAQAALAAASAHAGSRTTEIAKIRSEIAHASVPGPSPSVGPYTTSALRLLRTLKADSDHAAAGREAADPAGAARLPARP